MSKNNNLVEIAKVLIEMKEERALHGVPASIMARYPEGSQGIDINEEKYIVLNSPETQEAGESDNVHELREKGLKYNPNFYLGTYESDEPDIIDDTHNKSKLINEAYTEVPFLPKDIYSQAEFNPEEGKAALRSIIDRQHLNINDFDDYRVEKPLYQSGNVYDEIYRCRCVFNDISGNESVESLLIKAFKVSNQKDAEYSYKIISSENIKEQVEELENRVADDTTGEMRSVYSKVSAAEYADIEKHIREGIEQYYLENSKKFYRLTRVDIKAIYCLRLKKNPIVLNLLVDNSIVATLNTFYSMVAGDFNVFTCPNCNALSSEANSYDGIKIHVDHDYTDMDEDMLGAKHPIGCSDCMERCSRCGGWHFKFSEYTNIISKGFNPIDKRRFLKYYSNKDFRTEALCSCRENLSWIYDEMSLVKKNGKEFFEKVVDKFLSGACKLAFINYSTGEVIANYDDYIDYVHDYLQVYLKKNTKIYKKFISAIENQESSNVKKDRVHNFTDMYIVNEANEFDGFFLETYIEQSILDFKKGLADAFNVSVDLIKATDVRNTEKCSCCGGLYYKDKNTKGEAYYNSVKNLCCCCSEASANNLKFWSRTDDGVTFYKPKKKDVAIRTFQSMNGEEYYDKWLKESLLKIVEKLKTVKVKEGQK